MKGHPYFFSTLFLFTALSLLSMDHTHKIVIGREINDIEFPRGISYLDNDHLIITDQSKFNIIDIRQPSIKHTSKNDVELHSLKAVIPIVHNGNSKILTLYTNGTQMYNIDSDIYDVSIKTDAFKYLHRYVHHPLSSSVLFPMDFYASAIRRYEYLTDQAATFLDFEREPCVMSVHPKKEIICMADYQGNISFHHLDGLSKPFKRIKLPIQTNRDYFCEYTPQGDNIAVVVDEKVFNIDVTSKPTFTYSHLQRQGNNKLYGAPVAFHPNGILVLVCNLNKTRDLECLTHYKICYWDISQHKPIYTTPDIEGPIIKFLTFAPGAREYALFLADYTCEVHRVPFEVLYQSSAKQIICYCLSVLNRLQEEHYLPQDIKKYIAYIVLDALKR